MEDPVKIDKASNNETSVNLRDRTFKAEYVLKNDNEMGDRIQMQNEMQDAESKSNSEDNLEGENVENERDLLLKNSSWYTGLVT